MKFESYINDVLKEDLAKLSAKLEQINAECAEFLQLKSFIITLQTNEQLKYNFKTQLDLGNHCYMEAKIDDPTYIYMDVGLGHYVEFTLEDALALIDVRTKLLKRQSQHLRGEVARTNAHVKLMLLGIRDLQNLNK